MITTFIAFVFMPALWLACEAYCALLACERLERSCVIETGGRREDLLA